MLHAGQTPSLRAPLPRAGSRRSRALPIAGALLALLLSGAEAAAQVDFLVARLEVTQAVQTGSTPLVAGRSTFVRVSVAMLNPPPLSPQVDGLLRLYVDGVESPDSPVFSLNGPFTVPAAPNPLSVDGTLNFAFRAPESDDVVLVVEVNPPGPNFVAEANTANNAISSPSLEFRPLATPELAYVPIDYRPSGGPTPNLPPLDLIEPGVGDNFVQGIYPAADFHYHRTDAPSKLWTSSLSGTGSSLLSSLDVDINLMSPQPDFLYGWVPGGLSYNGQAFISGKVSMGNTQDIRHQRTYAHELGHNHGLFHNTTTVNLVGVDVEHHLNLTEGLPQIKAPTLKDIMYAGLLTQEAWVAASNYEFFVNHPVYQPGNDQPLVQDEGSSLLVTGLWDPTSGAVQLVDVLAVPGSERTAPAAPGEADLLVTAFAGGERLLELPVAVRSSADTCPACGGGEAPAHDEPAGAHDDPVAPAPLVDDEPPATGDNASGADAFSTPSPVLAFSVRLPLAREDGTTVDRLSVSRAGARPVAPLQRERSAAAPQASFTGLGPFVEPQLTVAWVAADPDGDALRHYLRYSPDGGQRWVPLASGLEQTALDVDLSALPLLRDGRAVFELRVSDGLHTTVVQSQPLARSATWAGSVGNAPWIEVMTPDDPSEFRFGSTVILHSSGWDLEDRALDGASIVWSSNLDGVVGTGRHTSVTDLSPGSHVLTVTATDSDGLQTSDTTTVFVTDRDLPDVGGGTVCQADLGFGGPGSLALSLCGSDLSTGTLSELLLTGAPASAPAFLLVGLTNNPTPFAGGQLVPVPFAGIEFLATDGAGQLALGVPGGGGPVTIYAQFVVPDAGLPGGYAVSNALEVELLP